MKLVAATVLCAAMTVCAALVPRPAHTQADAMGQGEAAINVRSDVKLGVKGTGGTPSERLAKLGQAVADQMEEIRSCYRKLVATAPEIAGALQLKLALTEGKKPAVEIMNAEGGADGLSKCVTNVLRAAQYQEVGRPAAAVLSLEFDNSRARGQAAMNAKQAEIGRMAVQDSGDGGKQASWSTDGGQVRFTVKTEPGTSPETVQSIMRGFQEGYAAFLDCRRKCEKGGTSPEGDIHAALAIDRSGKARVKLGEISVAHERAPTCGAKAFERIRFEKPDAPLRAQVIVHFAP